MKSNYGKKNQKILNEKFKKYKGQDSQKLYNNFQHFDPNAGNLF